MYVRGCMCTPACVLACCPLCPSPASADNTFLCLGCHLQRPGSGGEHPPHWRGGQAVCRVGRHHPHLLHFALPQGQVGSTRKQPHAVWQLQPCVSGSIQQPAKPAQPGSCRRNRHIDASSCPVPVPACRDGVRARLAPGDFLECYMRIPIEVGRFVLFTAPVAFEPSTLCTRSPAAAAVTVCAAPKPSIPTLTSPAVFPHYQTSCSPPSKRAGVRAA